MKTKTRIFLTDDTLLIVIYANKLAILQISAKKI